MSFGFDQITALQKLLAESNEASQKTNLQPPQNTNKVVVTGRKVTDRIIKENETNLSSITQSVPSKAIWNDDEIPTKLDLLAKNDDSLPAPKYNFFYRNLVGAEDLFMSTRDSNQISQNVSHLVVKIHFIDSTMKDIDLEVQSNFLRATSKYHRLFTQLPCIVNPDQGNAKCMTELVDDVKKVLVPHIESFMKCVH